ncbi:hypothetical protein GCM10027360_01200 [Amycolatopsis echigonensis]
MSMTFLSQGRERCRPQPERLSKQDVGLEPRIRIGYQVLDHELVGTDVRRDAIEGFTQLSGRSGQWTAPG